MKAVICTNYGPPEVLQLQEVKQPQPNSNEVLIKIHATTVTVADFRVRSFTVPISFWLPARIVLGLLRPKKNILGVELSGEIEAIGKDVTLFKKGDLIFAATLLDFGAYAEYTCLPETGPIALKPSTSTHEEAAAIPIGARTALHYLKRGNIEKGKRILILGASGSVGTYAVQLAKYYGGIVTGVCSRNNMNLVKSLGADVVIDYTETTYRQQLETYDLIFVAIDKYPFSMCLPLLNEKGTYLNISQPVKSLHMLWISLLGKKRVIAGENPSESAQDLVFLKKLVEAGVLKPVIDRSYTLAEIVEAHRYVEKGHKKGNVVIRVSHP